MFKILMTSGVSAAVVSVIVGYFFKTRTEKKIATLKAELDKTVFVTKLQYEHEYAVYRELWSALIDLRRSTLRLRPMIDVIPRGEEEAERQKRLKEFGRNAELFRDVWEKNRPFYAIPVYEKLDGLFQKCYEESIKYANLPNDKSEYWEDARKNCDAIIKDFEEVCIAIRDRLNQMTVL